MPLQWRNQIWQSLEEDAGKRCSECAERTQSRDVLAGIVPDGKALGAVAVDSGFTRNSKQPPALVCVCEGDLCALRSC